MASDIKTFLPNGKGITQKQRSNIKAAQAASADEPQQIRARLSQDRGIKGGSVRVTNPKYAGYKLSRRPASLGIGGV